VVVRVDLPGPHEVSVRWEGGSADALWRDAPGGYDVAFRGRVFRAGVVDERRKRLQGLAAAHRPTGPVTLRSAMPGKVVAVLAEVGQEVAAGAGVVVIEAMKMENELKAPVSGRITRVAVAAGGTVEGGQVLVEIEAGPEGAR